MDREISVDYTPRLIRTVYGYLAVRNVLPIFVLVLVMAGANYRVSSLSGSQRGLILAQGAYDTLFAVFVLYLIYLVFAYLKSYFQLVKKVKGYSSSVYKYRFTDDFLYLEMEMGAGKNKWAVYNNLIKFKKVWLLTVPTSFYILPTDLLDDDLKEFLLNKVVPKKVVLQRAVKLVAAFVIGFALVYFASRR